jgi:hypothetical protein
MIFKGGELKYREAGVRPMHELKQQIESLAS